MRKLNGRLWTIALLTFSVGLCAIGCGEGSSTENLTATSSSVQFGFMGESGPQVFFAAEGGILNWDPQAGLSHLAAAHPSEESDAVYALTAGNQMFMVRQVKLDSGWNCSVSPIPAERNSSTSIEVSKAPVEDVAVLDNYVFFKVGVTAYRVLRGTTGSDGVSIAISGRVFGIRNQLVTVDGVNVSCYDESGNPVLNFVNAGLPQDPSRVFGGTNGLYWTLAGAPEIVVSLDLSGTLDTYLVHPPSDSNQVFLDEHDGRILVAFVKDSAVSSLQMIDPTVSREPIGLALPSPLARFDQTDPLSRRLGVQFLFLP